MRLRPSLGCGSWESTFSSTWVLWIVQVQSLGRGCVWLLQTLSQAVWQQIHDQAPTQAMNPSLSLCCHSTNQFLHLSAQEGNTDKDQSLFTDAKVDCIISSKKRGCFGFRYFFFYLWHSICIISSLSLWILVFFFFNSVYWFVEWCADVSVSWCNLHALCCMGQEMCCVQGFELKCFWRARFCMMCENQMPVKFHMSDV